MDPSDVVALAIYQEGKNGQVFLDISHKNAEETKLRFPQIYQKLKKYGLDMTREPIPISPAAHYACGGILVNLKGETGIKNLYAFGEVACTGVHGANRLASNSLLEALVFSNEILKNAQSVMVSLSNHDISGTPFATLPFDKLRAGSAQGDNAHFPFAKPIKLSLVKKKRLKKIIKTVQNLMWEKVGIVRSQKGLREALKKLNTLQKELPAEKYVSPLLHRTRSIVYAARLITVAAIQRKKSLGSHVIQGITPQSFFSLLVQP
ncbi:FAD-binding protein, partial [Candidatus Peregrinibacteria bacterium]|nr:FAD-binding protein [Candidatus Peregrinibacteria bacterium]